MVKHTQTIRQQIDGELFDQFVGLALKVLREFKWINQLVFSLKSSEDLFFSGDFRGSRS